jgi:hypothetical protein
MKRDIFEALEKQGFNRPPPSVLYRDDPRGVEYGHYEARSVFDSQRGECILIHKLSPGGTLLWRALFLDVEDFTNWAEDCL